MADALQLHIDGPDNAETTVILAHGAGAGMDTDFMQAFAIGLASAEFRVIRFEFAYLRQRRDGKRTAPPRAERLIDEYLEVIERADATKRRCVIGGKSMGGRVASLLADDAPIAGLIGLGFPFQAPGKPNPTRVAHLAKLRTPTQILQGTRDPFGDPTSLAKIKLSASIQIHWLDDGNHDLVPRKKSGRTTQQNWSEGITVLTKFLRGD